MFQLNFRVFVCAFRPEISLFFGESFLSLFLFFVIHTSLLSFPHGLLDMQLSRCVQGGIQNTFYKNVIRDRLIILSSSSLETRFSGSNLTKAIRFFMT